MLYLITPWVPLPNRQAPLVPKGIGSRPSHAKTPQFNAHFAQYEKMLRNFANTRFWDLFNLGFAEVLAHLNLIHPCLDPYVRRTSWAPKHVPEAREPRKA